MRFSVDRPRQILIRQNARAVKKVCPDVTSLQIATLRTLSQNYGFSIDAGDLLLVSGRWYVTHAGLLRLAQRRRCRGIITELSETASDPKESRWVFKATVRRSAGSFLGYGDADPSNVSSLVHGAEMRVAETRAVNRALRKAYGISVCSFEEIGKTETPPKQIAADSKILPVRSTNGDGRSVRDRLCQVIRQHQLDPNLVKSYATEFCGVKALREATREQVEEFVIKLADWAEKDRNALLCQLNSYLGQKEGAA
jgi:hypothetical protein